MKRKIFNCFILALMFLIPFSVDAKENVVISNVKKVEEKGRHEPFAEPTFNDLTLNVNGTFVEVGDSVLYEITFENKDNVDHKFKGIECPEGATCSPGISFSKNEYLNEHMSCEDGTVDAYTIKANSTKKCYFTFSYVKDVPDNLLTNDKFVSNNVIEIKIDSNDVEEESIISSLKNPQTSTNFIIMMLPLVIVISGLILGLRKKKKLGMFIFIIGVSVIPVSVLATSFITIKVNSNIEISPMGEFCYVDGSGQYSNHKFRYGMDWITFMNGNYNNEAVPFYIMPENPTIDWGSVSGTFNRIDSYGPPQNWNGEGSFIYKIDTELDKIKPADEVCYMSLTQND